MEFFQKLDNLRSLELVEISGTLLVLPEGVFNPLNRLETLKIADSQLQRLPTDIFCSLKNLQVRNLGEILGKKGEKHLLPPGEIPAAPIMRSYCGYGGAITSFRLIQWAGRGSRTPSAGYGP